MVDDYERELRETYDHIFAHRKEEAKVVPIDENMRVLVETLNRLPGIATIACCGGHENPDRTQRPAGEWFVTIQTYRYDERGWDGLGVIRSATFSTDNRVQLRFASSNGDFFIDGKGIHPNDFATLVFQERARQHRTKTWRPTMWKHSDESNNNNTE